MQLLTSFYEYQLLDIKKFEFHVDKTNLILKNLILNKTYSCSVVQVGKRVEYCTKEKNRTKQNSYIFFFKSGAKLSWLSTTSSQNVTFIYQSISW